MPSPENQIQDRYDAADDAIGAAWKENDDLRAQLAASQADLEKRTIERDYFQGSTIQLEAENAELRRLLGDLLENCDKTFSDKIFHKAERAAHAFLNPPEKQ
jgi:hypothetical protein